WLIASAAVTGSAMAPRFQQQRYSRDLRPKHLRVSILNAHQYSGKLDELVYEGLRLFKLKVRGKSVLLKPNIVEYIPGRPVNTDPQLIGATAEAFLRLGAASVKVAKGLVIIGTQNSLFTKLASPISSCTERFPSSISIATNSYRQSYWPLCRTSSPVAPTHRAGIRLHRIYAEGEDPPLDRRDAEHEEHVRHCSRLTVWLAQKRPSLGGNPRKHSRYLRDRPTKLCDR